MKTRIFPNSKDAFIFDQPTEVLTFKLRLIRDSIMPSIQQLREEKIKIVL